jgi:hypothetical protein
MSLSLPIQKEVAENTAVRFFLVKWIIKPVAGKSIYWKIHSVK